MGELRTARVEDAGGIVAIDPESLGSPDEIRVLIRGGSQPCGGGRR
jgi:hypothetical protein